MTDIDLLGPGDAGAARTLTSSNSTVTAAIAHPDADDTWFADCVANTAGTGTPLVAKFLNRWLQQIRRLVRNSGIPLSNADDDMLGQAIQTESCNWAGTFGGTANALTATLTPVPPTLTVGMRVVGLVSSPNTSTTPTLNVNSLGAVTIVNGDGSAVGVGTVSGLATFTYDGTNWRKNSNSGRLLRTSVYTLISGVQNVSVNGAAFTTTGAGTFSPLTATTSVLAKVQAGGASGGGVANAALAGAGGGAGGNYGEALFTSGFSGGLTVAVGAGGAAATSGNHSGNAGGTSSFGSLLSCTGGAAGGGSAGSSYAYWTINALGGAAGTTGSITGATLAIPGGAGAPGVTAIGAGCTNGDAIGGSGGASALGQSGGASVTTNAIGTSSASVAGVGYGSGSSGACTFGSGAMASVAGQPGAVIILEYA